MTTALQMIDRSYSLIGLKAAGEPLSADDANYALNALNSMLDIWNTQSMFILSVQEVVASISASSATIGTSGAFNTTRPTRLEKGCFARVNGIDYEIELIDRVRYEAISNKTVTGPFPMYAYYDAVMPTANVYFWPVPSACEIHLAIQTPLTAFADLATLYTLAPGYQNAIEYSLAEQLEPGIRSPSPQIQKMAMNSRRLIRRTNVSVPTLDVIVPTSPRYSYDGLYRL